MQALKGFNYKRLNNIPFYSVNILDIYINLLCLVIKLIKDVQLRNIVFNS